jgi:hypothetical protein
MAIDGRRGDARDAVAIDHHGLVGPHRAVTLDDGGVVDDDGLGNGGERRKRQKGRAGQEVDGSQIGCPLNYPGPDWTQTGPFGNR